MDPAMTRSIRLTLVIALAALVAGCAGPPDGGNAAAAPLKLAAETLTQPTLSGAPSDLATRLDRGETVVLVFWQTWCESCRREAPAIAKAAEQERGSLTFLGVVPGADANVSDAEITATAGRWGYTFPQLRDRELALTRALGVEGTPTIVVLGPGPNDTGSSGARILYREHRLPDSWASYRSAVPLAATPIQLAGAATECVDGVCPLPTGATP